MPWPPVLPHALGCSLGEGEQQFLSELARRHDSCAFVLQIDVFQHMQHFVQTMQQQAQHAIATEDQQHKQELHKLAAR